MLFHFGHHPKDNAVAHPSTTLMQVRQLMADILSVPVERVHPNDSFATLVGKPEDGLDDSFLDICALEVAFKERFHLDITEEENDSLFNASTTAQQFASYVEQHRSH